MDGWRFGDPQPAGLISLVFVSALGVALAHPGAHVPLELTVLATAFVVGMIAGGPLMVALVASAVMALVMPISLARSWSS